MTRKDVSAIAAILRSIDSQAHSEYTLGMATAEAQEGARTAHLNVMVEMRRYLKENYPKLLEGTDFSARCYTSR